MLFKNTRLFSMINQLENTMSSQLRNIALAITIAVLFTISMLFMLALSAPKPSNTAAIKITQQNPLDVSVQNLKRMQAYQYQQQFIGFVKPQQQSHIGFEVAGQVAEIVVDEGIFVQKGDKIAVLNTDILQAQLDEAKAGLKQAYANLELARLTLKRFDKLEKNKLLSAQNKDEAQQEYQAQLAAVDVYKARLHTIELQIEKSTIYAPYNGIITKRFMDIGQVINLSEPIVTIESQENLEAYIGIPDKMTKYLEQDYSYNIMVNENLYTANIKNILPVTSSNRTATLILNINANHSDINSNALVYLNIPITISSTGFWIPLESLIQAERGLWAVYIAKPLKNNIYQIEKRLVEILYSDEKQAFVRGNLADQELLINTGLQRVVPQQIIKISKGI